ncbi:MAG: hypothetical protein N4A45_11875 [Flavobacteriales bacterium]|jgi:hypothetical protein|nr:hypothetical protein [Flavobacteriales bacterium]
MPNLYSYVSDLNYWVDPFGLFEIFRGMKNDNGLPKVEPSARGLGVRPNVDIPVDSNGIVSPGTGGMSMSPSSDDLPLHRKPPAFGGTGKDSIWKIDTEDLGDDLKYVPDKPGHGTIQPKRKMTLDSYQKALAKLKEKFSSISFKCD